MNNIVITGNLTKEPTVVNTKDGKLIGKGTLAVNRPYNREITDFFEFDVRDSAADYYTRYAHKGDRIEIIGIMESHEYENKNGEKVYRWVVRVSAIQLLPKIRTKSEEEKEEDDDMLF